jgi:hypothetical protein
MSVRVDASDVEMREGRERERKRDRRRKKGRGSGQHDKS